MRENGLILTTKYYTLELEDYEILEFLKNGNLKIEKFETMLKMKFELLLTF